MIIRPTHLAVAAALILSGSIVSGAKAEPQPHMQAALAALQNAKAQLQVATADKGGHRVKAMALIDSAMAEVRAGIAFDNRR